MKCSSALGRITIRAFEGIRWRFRGDAVTYGFSTLEQTMHGRAGETEIRGDLSNRKGGSFRVFIRTNRRGEQW
jgi:hypothetical protein